MPLPNHNIPLIFYPTLRTSKGSKRHLERYSVLLKSRKYQQNN